MSLRLIIDNKGNLWKLDQWDCYVIHHGPAPADAVVIQADFDGFKTRAEEFDKLYGIRKYNMRVASQTTTYELTVTELKELMAEKLGVPQNTVEIKFKTREVGDDRFGSTYQETYALEVVVSSNKPTTPMNDQR